MSKYYTESLRRVHTMGYDYYEHEGDTEPVLTVTLDEYPEDSVVGVWPNGDGCTDEYEGVTFGNPHGAFPNIKTPVFWNGKRIGDASGKTDDDWLLSLARLLMAA